MKKKLNELTPVEYLEWFDNRELRFEMFTTEGNRKAKSITRRLIKKVFGKQRITQSELEQASGKLLAEAYKDNRYSEILDSEPPYHIGHYTKLALQIVGYDFKGLDIESKVWEYIN